jgi:hypothetical protein
MQNNVPVDYNVNASPLLTSYNHTNNNGINPLITIDELANIRGSGMYNPAPLYLETTNRRNALSKPDQYNNNSYGPVNGELYVNPSGSVDVKGTWESNINYDIQPESGDNYKNFDEYQRWALNVTRITDPYILPFLFSKINVKFIQDSVVDYVKKERNITINTRQDIDHLLNLMLKNYILYYKSNGIPANNNCAISPSENQSSSFSSILANINKSIVEKYVQSVLSTLNMSEYYLNDISNLRIPLSNPVLVSNKGSNVLGYAGPFENNHEFTRNISSFNSRDLIPGIIDSIKFGN